VPLPCAAIGTHSSIIFLLLPGHTQENHSKNKTVLAQRRQERSRAGVIEVAERCDCRRKAVRRHRREGGEPGAVLVHPGVDQQRCEKTALFLSFSYVCPEPVLVK
jgi:hypothetical protein